MSLSIYLFAYLTIRVLKMCKSLMQMISSYGTPQVIYMFRQHASMKGKEGKKKKETNRHQPEPSVGFLVNRKKSIHV